MGESFDSLEKVNLAGKRIAVVRGAYNHHITQELANGCRDQLQALGASDVTMADVPGAYELPLAAQWYGEAGYDAVVCLGAIIRGGTAHFDYVCDAVTQGCTQVQLTLNIPVVFGVLTCDNEQQALDRIGGSVGHKGVEAADTVAVMLGLRATIPAS